MKRRWCGRRHGSICAALRPNPPAVSSLPGDDPRLRYHSEGTRPNRISPPTRAEGPFSPFVLSCFDSESGDADPRRTSLALSYRLARGQPDRALHSRAGSLRALPPPAWPLRGPARHRRGMVGPGRARLVRRSRTAIAAAARVRSAGAYSHHAQARLSCNCAPQPRSDLQRTGLAKSRGALPTLPHDPRRGRASPAPLVECLPPARNGRPLLGALPLTRGWQPTSPNARRSSTEARTCGTSGTCSRHGAHRRPPLRRGSWRRLRGEDATSLPIDFFGGDDDRSYSGSQDDRDGTTAARR